PAPPAAPPLSLRDALPISDRGARAGSRSQADGPAGRDVRFPTRPAHAVLGALVHGRMAPVPRRRVRRPRPSARNVTQARSNRVSSTATDHIVSHAAGAVLWRAAGPTTSDIEVAVVHRPRYDDWSLPKGH